MAGRQDMRTPRWLFEFLEDRMTGRIGGFHLDAAATKRNRMCENYYGRRENGLKQPWRKWTFCNPPFADMLPWVMKAIHECTMSRPSVMLAPVGCSQEWWRRAMSMAWVYHPNRRISFNLPNGKPTKNADRDTIVLVFSNRREYEPNYWRVMPLPLPEIVL